MAPNESGSPTRGRHSQQAVKQRQAEEQARLQEEREHAREALRAAQERGGISIPRARRSRAWVVVLLALAILALGAYFGRSYIADFARGFGVEIPFLSTTETQSATSQGTQGATSSGSLDSSKTASAGGSSASSAAPGAASPGSTSKQAASKAASASSSSARPATTGSASAGITTASLAAIPRATGFGGFALDSASEVPIPTPSAREAIGAAYADIEQAAPCGFVFLNLKTGRGLCCNSGTPIYAASAFKAPYAYYLLANAEQGALLSDDDRSNIEAALVESDNDAYDALHYAHDTQEYNNWLEAHGVTNDPTYGFYPNIDAATMAQLWGETYLYLESGSDEATWMRGLLERTRVSFIRDGLAEADVTVWDKGGWISDEDGAAVNDAGIVKTADGDAYLVVIMTGQDNSGAAQQRVAALARALFDARGALG